MNIQKEYISLLKKSKTNDMKTITKAENEINFWTIKLENELRNGNEYEINQAEEMLKKLTNK